MSFDRMLNALRRHINAAIDAVPQPRWGIVMSVDPNRPAVKVMIQPDNVPSGWLPVAQSAAGGALTQLAPIPPGSLAFLVPEAGSRGADYVAVGFVHSDTAPPPKVANSNGSGGTQNSTTAAWAAGEWLVVANGSVMRLTAGGNIYLRPGSGTVQIDGSLVVNGDVSDRHGSLDRLRGNYDAHTHGGVQPGVGSTGTTSNPDPE